MSNATQSARRPSPDSTVEGPTSRGRPARVTGAIVLLTIGALGAFLWAVLSVLGYVESGRYDGIATRMSFVEYIIDMPDQILIPLGVALASAGAALGVVRRRQWGRRLAIGLALAMALTGLVLLFRAVLEWNLPGSFAILLVPPGLILLLSGASLAYAMISAPGYFFDRSSATSA
jgi:hypothetical protein